MRDSVKVSDGTGAGRGPMTGVDESAPERVRIGDLELAWLELGPTAPEPAASPVPPLVLVHGFTGHRDDFIGIAPTLARHRRVIAPDLRGHGDSDSPAGASGYSFELLLRDLEGLLDHLDVPRVDLLGHSFGGMVTLRFALAYPERLRSAVFLNTAPELPPLLPREGYEKASAIAEARGMAGLQAILEKAGRASPDPIVESWGERFWRHHRRRFCAMTPTSYRALGRVLFESESLVDQLSSLDLPSLVIVGEGDIEFLPGADLFEAHLPRAQRVTIPGAGHHPHQENTPAWLDAMEAHWARLESEGRSEGRSEGEGD